MRIGYMKKFSFGFTSAEGATHVAQPVDNRNLGFTLAEVLVTLGIIGVVAALTMPTLVSNHKKAVLKSQFKKAFSTISQAYDAAAVSLGYYPQCYYWEDYAAHHCSEYGEDNECTKYVYDDSGLEISYDINGPRSKCKPLFDAMANNLKVVKRCDGNAFADGCIPDYKGLDTVAKSNNSDLSDADATKQTSGCRGFRENNIKTKSTALVLADGSIYITYGTDDWYRYPLFLVDINGKKGPNKWGHDLFALQLKGAVGKEYWVSSGGCFYPEKDGVYPETMIKE